MNHSNNTRSIPLIFANPLSKVRIGSLYSIPVAAIKESPNESFRFWRKLIAMSLISGVYEIIRQSSKRALHLFCWTTVIPGIPSNSISVTNDTANNFSVYEIKRTSPSNKLIKILVSAKKSIFTSHLLLVFQTINTTLQSTKMFFQRWLFFALLKLSQCFFNIRPGSSLFYCDNHIQI